MNYKMIRYIIGQLLLVEGALMLLPLAVSLIYGEFQTSWAFVIPILALVLFGGSLTAFKPKDKALRAKDGFVIVGLSWIILSFRVSPIYHIRAYPEFCGCIF